MGRIGKLISFLADAFNGVNYKEAKSDLGGDEVVSSEHFSAPGIDSAPLEGDFNLLTKIPQTGGFASSGYIDSQNTPMAGPGETRSYGRSSAGATVNEVYLKTDGTVLIKNDSAQIEIASSGAITVTGGGDISITDGTGTVGISGGTIDLNGVTIDVAGILTGTVASFSSVTTGGLAFSGGGGVTGDLSVSGDVEAGGISLSSHVHGGVTTGTGVTSGPQ